ncbi:MAG TPA: hypothetical protein VH437_08930 [Terriglobales bacterium]|jgi:hypothetical protein
MAILVTVLIVMVATATAVVTYFLSRRAFESELAELRRDFDARLDAVVAKIPAPSVAAAAQPSKPVERPTAVAPAPVPIAAREEVTPETLLIIAAAVTAFMGKKVRIRSAKMLYAHESFNPWSQQGRAVVQASHNLAQGY